jgi:hypothetical protein
MAPNGICPLLTYIPNNVQRGKIFPILSAILYLNKQISPGHHITLELIDLFHKFPNSPIGRMGFPPQWQNEPTWTN